MAMVSRFAQDSIVTVVMPVALALVFRWLWKAGQAERAALESGRKIFPPTRAIRVLASVCATFFASLAVASAYSIHNPAEWWVPYMFLPFLALAAFMIPPVLTIDVAGVESRWWFGREKQIRWEEIASLQYNDGNRQFTVKSKDGRKITHGGFNVDQPQFQVEVMERSRAPLRVARPGVWKTHYTEFPYEEGSEEQD